jgi:hypothetical protein
VSAFRRFRRTLPFAGNDEFLDDSGESTASPRSRRIASLCAELPLFSFDPERIPLVESDER